MKPTEILDAYRSGQLSMSEVEEMLREMQQKSFRSALSEGQKGLWMLQKMSPGMSAYNIPLCFRVHNELNRAKFQEALHIVQAQFPILTSVIRDDNGIPYQIVQPEQPLLFLMEDISAIDPTQLQTYMQKKSKEPFVLDQGPLMRTHLFSVSEQEYWILITIHHIIFDGISMVTFITALFNAYEDLIQGERPLLATLPANYHDFVKWEQDMLAGREGAEHLAYWKQQLAGTLPILEFPTDHPRSSMQQFSGQAYTSILADELGEHVKSYATSQNVNVSIIYLAIFKVLLHKYTEQEDIIIGMPTMGRPTERFDAMIGYFINLIAVRSSVMGEQSFQEFMRNLQVTVVDGLDHAAYPFPTLVRELNVDRTRSRSPIFQVAFFYQNFFQSNSLQELQDHHPALNIEFIAAVRQEGEFELALEVYVQENRTSLSFIYNPDLYDSASIESMMQHYVKLVEEIVYDPSLPLTTYSMLSDEEQTNLLIDWNATRIEYPQDKCIHEVFAEKVKATPEAVAVIFAGVTLTYREVDAKSTQLAMYLQEQGVGPECLVGICVERSFEMVIGILGILKAGGAYVPMDPHHPDALVEYVLEDSKVSIVLVQVKLWERMHHLSKMRARVIALDKDWEEIVHGVKRGKALKWDVRPSHLAYVLYTSGSTGKPKGVMVEHRSIMNTLYFLETKYPVTCEDAYLLKTSYVFDVSLSELFGWFIGQGHLVILPPDGEKSPALFMEYIEKYAITHINFVPALLNVFLSGVANAKTFIEHCPIKYMLVAGEAFSKELVKKAVTTFKNSSVENIYGPTETSIYATWFSCTKNKITSSQTPIGRPIANTQVYIVDRHLNPVPIGIPGELCIAGDGLARGYYQQSALTAEKFIKHPFQPGSRLYKTGDLVRWLADGQIEYLGRIDQQVKIRGFRVELGAIESRVGEYPGVQETITVVHQQNETKRLVTYYTVLAAAAAPSVHNLREHVKASLPDYMVPAHFIRLDALPLTPNGKINRQALENRPLTLERTEQRQMARSQVEQTILELWQELLQVSDIGIDDGFFDVGGDSLLAIVVAQRISKELACNFPVTAVFEHPTIRAISAAIVEQYGDAPRAEDVLAGPIADRQDVPQEQPQHASALELPEVPEESIAIIGISCQFPGASTYREFWQNLRAGTESLRFFTAQELRDLGVAEELIANPNYVPVRASIEGKDRFDAGFFAISPKDAELMDPQLRLLLLHAWKAVEDAGYVSRQIPQTSVYMSASTNGYRALLPPEITESSASSDGYVSWVLAQSGTIPTMISHKLGLTGPSYFVHANCSSSLVGLYAAVQSLRSGEVSTALVGGSTLHVQSGIGYVHQPGLNFSSDGHVKAFDAGADGMAGGEGVAVVLLKRAVDAVNDGDHIYALLRGIGLNNDGAEKVGFYAPSVKGQAAVIRSVLQETAVPVESISYIEAHGTGTKLGDPIEVAALQAVYRQQTDKTHFCGLGSVKSNIGHLDTVAGLAGSIKVALSLYHQELVPTINYQHPNPVMDLEHSPFYVMKEAKVLAKRSTPYRAALSSFGLGGTNAHAIFEQYVQPERQEVSRQGAGGSRPSFIPLSARNEERLRAYVQELLTFLSTSGEDVSVAELAYTFQVGREAMEHRVVFVACELEELKQQLQGFLQGKEQIAGCIRGERSMGKETAWLEEDEGSEDLQRLWIARGKLKLLAQMWSRGWSLDWTLLYPHERPHRLSLPTYPFAQERYWPQSRSEKPKQAATTALLHPLLHQNTSVLSEQRFSSTFTGQEYFIAEHIIQGTTIVPGVVTLEMARAAFEQASDSSDNSGMAIRLRNVVWVRPIVVADQALQVHVGLYEEDNGLIYYNMYSESKAVEAETLLYNQGIAEFYELTDEPLLNLASIRNECNQGNIVSKSFYEGMIGAEYGPGYRGVQVVYTGQDQLLAKLALPDSVSDTRDQYVLHPSMMDAALQVAEYLQNITRAKLLSNSGEPFQVALPFALQELDVIRKCVPVMWVYVKYSEGNKVADVIQKVDIELCDDSGAVCVRIKGFSTRVLDGDARAAAAQSESLLLELVWREQPVSQETHVPEYGAHIVLLCDAADGAHKNIISSDESMHVSVLDSGSGTLAERFQTAAEHLFERIQAILGERSQDNVLLQIVVPMQGEQQVFAGLIGLLRTARLEQSRLIGQLIEVESAEEHGSALAAKLQEERRNPSEQHIRYQAGKRLVAAWSEMAPAPVAHGEQSWKDHGVYLITGGMGSLGLLFAREIVQRAQQVTVILTGRSPLSVDEERQLEALRGMGAWVVYKQTDAADRGAVERLIQEIQEDYGHLNGIMHAAGIIKDSFISKKTREELRAVMAPKVAGLVHLDEASKHLALDFFVLFSSISGSIGSVGQADYAMANTFMDAYAIYRNTLISSKKRSGKILSINWPLWKDGGMHVDAETERQLTQKVGIVPMLTETGIQALYKGLAAGKSQIMVVEGRLQIIRQRLLQAADPVPPQRKKETNTPAFTTGIDVASLQEKVRNALKQEVAKILKVKTDEIDYDTELASYGLDSISMTVFTNKLNRTYKLELTPAIFFEHPTLQDLAAYLTEAYRDIFVTQFAVYTEIKVPAQNVEEEKPEEIRQPDAAPQNILGKASTMKRRSRLSRPTAFQSPEQEIGTPEPIAIIGISGVFPMAQDIDAYWENLAAGKDCISEIPAERWDWQAYYGDPGKESNKTNVKWGGFIDGVGDFDPLFFGISPREAEQMEPQQRLLMTYAWKAIEDAGYSAQSLSGTQTGIFIGTGNTGYSSLLSKAHATIEGSAAANMSPSVGPSRVSYLLNIHGPSEPIDTACSSSLVAIHHAIQAIAEGNCDMAIVGGVNTIILPEVYISFDKAGALSKEGRCKTFSDRADGFAHGEGAGILILKKLEVAEQAGDHIYGVIRGTAVNHGGRASSLTTPNPKAQAELLQTAYTRARIDPRTVTYIEAHGTGTELGDPVEINGLKSAFKELYRATGDAQVTRSHCGLGSVKTNIGHLSLAAGVAGVIKVLLQLKHKTLVKSLHCERLNPYIQLQDSPFYIVQEKQAWTALKDAQGRELPRRAGVSSFGIGGVNAHVVIEEYVPRAGVVAVQPPEISPHNPTLLLWSAKNEERLKEQVQQMLVAIEKQRYSEEDLGAMAYTLQVGRDAMEERLGMIAGSLKELKEKLQRFVQGQEGIEDVYRGKVNKASVQALTADEEMQEAIEKWMQRRKYGKLLDLWVRGLNVEWGKLYGESRHRRISLPTYPFVRERYWVAQSRPGYATGVLTTSAASAITCLHPLLQQNTSNLMEQRFSSTFTGQEFFLADHVVKGQRILPGAAHLEMAREAVEQAAGLLEEDQTSIKLKNVVWIRPIVVADQPLKVHIGLYPEDDGEIAYEVYSDAENIDGKPILYSQGSAGLRSSIHTPIIDLPSLQAQCIPSTFSVVQVYEAYKMIGFDYGPAYRGLEKVYTGENLVLATVALPPSILDRADQYVLHPGLMDSALQASSLLTKAGEDRLMLPFAIQELEVFGKCTSQMWVYARYSEDSKPTDKMRKRDIDICDQQGNVSVRLKGLSFRVVEREAELDRVPKSIGTLMLEPVWKQQNIESSETSPEYEQHIVMLCEMTHISKQAVESSMKAVQCISLELAAAGIVDRFQAYAVQAFEKIQYILRDKPRGQILIQVVTSGKGEQQLFVGLLGLLKTANLENPKLNGQLIEMDVIEDIEGFIKKLAENKRRAEDRHIRYQKGIRYTADWSEIDVSQSKVKIPWKDKGVYLISGGVGGLGLLLAREIVQRVNNASIILMGRSELSRDKRAQIQELQLSGATVSYVSTDVVQQDDVHDLVQQILKDHGKLNGIIHCAGIIHDSYIVNKTMQELQDVLAPKVKGLINLDEASKDLALDFVLLFSSISGAMGSAGQADYAMANSFMDVYAAYRNSLIRPMYRHGQTLSINWPLWREGGMRVGAETEKMMLRSTGVVAMETATGIQALYKGLASGKSEIVVMAGEVQAMRQKLQQSEASIPQQPRNRDEPGMHRVQLDTGSLSDKVRSALLQEVSRLLKIKADDINVDAEFNQYGFDSITLIEFANALNEHYKLKLTPTIFFEYANIQFLAAYLVEAYQDVFAARFAVYTRVEPPISMGNEEEVAVRLPNQRQHTRFARPTAPQSPWQETGAPEPIAIIGISGVFPMAQDVDAYWKNLAAGKDCISEIPAERWDWRACYGDPAREANKTNVKWGGFIDGVGDFDPLFFGISPREAEQMDPQQRLLMTYAWKAIEDAGYSAQSLSGTQTGIFIGTGNTGYSSLLANTDIEGSSAANMSPSVGPNRMSYLLNIHGPSEPIDTACSSSLVAIHNAVHAIEDGNCEMAIVGGVNTVVTPQGHIAYDKAGALSKEGRCKTFSDRADGFVVSEGVGILILKKLNAAEQAGDHIYGVIRGTAVNHGGRANSLTTPNPKAQAELLQTAYTRARIDPRTVTYIEAHGTGTELGDPVEINGLKSAFKELYRATGEVQVTTSHCGLGSVKTNIGHLSLAAGAAGVIKVLLQLKYKTLVKSLHCERLNPYIQLQDSPFYIVQEKQAWIALKDAQGQVLPRRAGVSSFGIGGVNAHVVIEEYVPRQGVERVRPIEINPQNPTLLLWSARNGERLKEQAQQMLEAIEKQRYGDEDLSDMAYTLQVGRDAMEERLGVIAGSLKELKEKLQCFVQGQEGIEDVYRGKVNKASFHMLAADEEMQETIEKWMQRRKYSRLLDLWVKGLNVEWGKLYREKKHRRISLPTYPFARERYWVSQRESKDSDTAESRLKTTVAALTCVVPPSILHPLLHRNTSDLSEQCFSSTFTGHEFFFADHKVNGSMVLPGVAYLEMARAAVTQAVRDLRDRPAGIRIRNVAWIQPIVAGLQPIQIHISLLPQENGEIVYEIYSRPGSASLERIIHGQGSIAIGALKEMPLLDLKSLLAQCTQSVLTSGQCYAIFNSVGIEYGPAHRGIEKVYIGQRQALAELSLPSSVYETLDQFVLHPGILDAALQASIGLRLGHNNDQLSLPFALQELEVFARCTARMWAYARFQDGVSEQDKMQKVDIALCDEQGRVCVSIKGISSRVVEDRAHVSNGDSPAFAPSGHTNGSSANPLMLAPVWDVATAEKDWQLLSVSDQVVIIGGDDASAKAVRQLYPRAQRLDIAFYETSEEIAKRLEECSHINHIIWISPPQGAEFLIDNNEVIAGQKQGVLQIFRLIKAMLHIGYGHKDVIWSVITERTQFVHKGDRVNPTHASVHGIVGSMAKEYTNWKVRLIDLQDSHTWPVSDLFTLVPDSQGNPWAYRNGEWYRQRLVPVSFQHTQPVLTMYRQGGVYVVIGGAGGIGETWSEYVIRSHQAHVFWIGRREKDEAIQSALDRLAAMGPAPIYIQADATDYKAMQRAYEEIKKSHACIHGIVHSAIVLADQSLANMNEERFRKVLAAKVDVSVHIAHVFHKEPLDFVLFFSSMQSFAKAAGQSNYAAGCSFKDAFAHRLAQEWPVAVKVMNWSYWGSIGIVASQDYQQKMARAGVSSIEPPEAMEALEILLASPLNQLALVKTASHANEEAAGLNEWVEVYPKHPGVNIQNLRKYKPGDRAKIRQVKERER